MSSMSSIKSIRTQLGMTQQEFADGIAVTQGNVSHYEAGQTVLPAVARRVIELARTRGFTCTFDDVYGEDAVLLPISEQPPAIKPKRQAHKQAA
jgi:putative transcriptional regulator